MVIYKTVEDEMIDVATICAAPARLSLARSQGRRPGGGGILIAADLCAREIDNPARSLRGSFWHDQPVKPGIDEAERCFVVPGIEHLIVCAFARSRSAGKRGRYDMASRKIDLAFDFCVIEGDAPLGFKTAVQNQFASNSDAVCKQGWPTHDLNLASPEAHLVAEMRGRQSDETTNLRASHEPPAPDRSSVRTDRKVAAALDVTFRERDLTIDLRTGKADAALQLRTAHRPVATNVDDVGFDRASMSVDFDAIQC